jgi:Predicted transcriptional regulator
MRYTDQDAWRQEVARRLFAARQLAFATTTEAANWISNNTDITSSQSSVSLWENAYRVPVTYNFIPIGTAYKKHPAYLAGLIDDLVFPESISNNPDMIGLSRDYLYRENIDANRVSYALMPDESMIGDIDKGDLIVIERCNQIQATGIYAITMNDTLLVRRFIVDPKENRISIKSNNQELFPDAELLANSYIVVGRVKKQLKNV